MNSDCETAVAGFCYHRDYYCWNCYSRDFRSFVYFVLSCFDCWSFDADFPGSVSRAEAVVENFRPPVGELHRTDSCKSVRWRNSAEPE